MKKSSFVIVMSILTLIITTFGATFSFFRVSAESSEGAVNFQAAEIGVSLDLQPLYVGKELIPLDNDKVMTAFSNSCVDKKDNGACQAYTITIANKGQAYDYLGTIKFNLDSLTNLNYMVLDENNNVYQELTNIVSGTDQSLGNAFNLLENGSRTFKIIVWVPNYDRPQDTEDAAGSFSASVTYSATMGSRVTGTFTINNG